MTPECCLYGNNKKNWKTKPHFQKLHNLPGDARWFGGALAFTRAECFDVPDDLVCSFASGPRPNTGDERKTPIAPRPRRSSVKVTLQLAMAKKWNCCYECTRWVRCPSFTL